MPSDEKTQPASVCDECAARHQGICGTLDPAQLERLKKQARRHMVDPGATLIDPAVPSDQFSVIVSGAVKLMKILPDGRQQIVGLQYAPDFLGRPYLGDSDITAKPVSNTKLCSFSRATVERMIENTPSLQHRLYLQALAELEDARELLLTLGRRTARERVAAFLMFVSRHTASPDTGNGEHRILNLLLTRGEIGDFLGLTIETVSRQLHRLAATGVVALEHNRSITILDIAKLRAESGDSEDTPSTLPSAKPAETVDNAHLRKAANPRS
ncbi:MAG: Crp/Fnr family transcriptional regulator [Alphaproteobacteria bacterium]